MCTRKVLSILLLPLFQLFSGTSFAVITNTDSILFKINSLSGRYLNYHCSPENDSAINFCQEAVHWFASQNRYINKLQAEQLAVNILCLKGRIEEGISMARKMYEEAKTLDSPLGKALALQAIGATYMHTGQYQQALSTYAEASPVIVSKGDTLSQIKLLTQQLHTFSKLDDTVNISSSLSALESLVRHITPSEGKDIYLFYISCYQTILLIKTHQPELAGQSLKKVSQILPSDKSLNLWRYYIQASFYKLKNNDKLVLSYVDSSIQIIRQSGRINEYKNSVHKKAQLLEKLKDYSGACEMYALADSLAGVQNMQQYIQQIENLHLTYFMDEAVIENAKMQNQLLTIILLCIITGILITGRLIFMARKRNKQLALSRERLNQIRQSTADSIQLKSMFLSNMSHDLRTPLNAIVGFSDILTDPEDIDSELKQQCRDYIRQNSDLLIKLTNDIIDFSTLKEAKIKFDFEKCDVIALCHNVVETVSNVKKTKAELHFFPGIEKLVIETDSGRLQQVLINLLTNAAKFTKEGSIDLRLDLNTQTQEAVFTIEDTGCGIPQDKQNLIFERFEKLHESAQGVGLGLSICKLIIEYVNGKIWIDSTYTKGARFIFTHPVKHTSQSNET